MSELLGDNLDSGPNHGTAYEPDDFLDLMDYDMRSDTNRIILNPRNFEIPKAKEDKVDFLSADYLGMPYLSSVERLRRLEELGAPPGIIESEKKLMSKNIEKARKQIKLALLKSILENPEDPELVSMIDSYPVPDELKNRITNNNRLPFHQAIVISEPEELAEFIKWNREYIETLAEQGRPKIEGLKKEYIEKIRLAITEQHLPLSIKQLESRMKSVSINLVDPMSMIQADRGGYYSASDRQISIAAEQDDNRLKKILFHELNHLISGHTIVEERRDIGRKYGFNEIKTTVSSHRVGTDISFGDGQSTRRWMNEAITEQLAQVLLTPEGRDIDFSNVAVRQFFQPQFARGTYLEERQLLYHFLPQNPRVIPAMLEAYFEDHLPSTPPGRRTTKRRRFYNELKKVHGNHVMADLRQMDQLYGVKDVKGMAAYITQLREKNLARLIFGHDIAKTP